MGKKSAKSPDGQIGDWCDCSGGADRRHRKTGVLAGMGHDGKWTPPPDTTLDMVSPAPITHYLDRIRHILSRLSQEPEASRLLSIRLAPDMFETGFHFAVAIRFAARALCPPAGKAAPQIPDQITCESLIEFHREIAELVSMIKAEDLKQPVTHQAGEAVLTQEPAEYISCFAFPNMLFHLSIGYAGLRHGGMKIGKADFDGFHVY